MKNQQLTQLQNDAYRAETERMEVTLNARAELRRNWLRFILYLIPMFTVPISSYLVATRVFIPTAAEIKNVEQGKTPPPITHFEQAKNASNHNKNDP